MMTRPSTPVVEVLPDDQALAEKAAEEFLRLLDQTLMARRQGFDRLNPPAQSEADRAFTVALAGGSTPRQLYTRLAAVQVDWESVHFFWGDERCVPPDHVDSNFQMANEALLSSISIPAENIHRIHGELPAERAALEYEEELRRSFGNKLPRFDLILLGLGGDGHTASLFPGSPAIQEKECWAASVQHKVPPAPLVDRVTLTLPVLNAAAQVFFLVSGAEKAERLRQVLNDPVQPDQLPAQAVKPVNGSITWLVDQAAAAKLSL